ncbi:flagellar export chaperone FliS [Neobacillus citreus]|uniref:Flagellar secretion chaperone FliS n=1 Tax=Neobacillus citreus TaxID=2833578 RepID=A0A942SUB6_9BACI|nr:flagellar export chaperone FliS [Neobacillus citreus]MCH6266830.1 flagellar export chaperone FliS [Neobacillus citreus]
MVLRNPYQTYQKQAVNTSKPEELTLMLYQGMVKYIRLSKIALQNQQIEDSHHYNLRTQDILSELMVTLKQEYSIAESLLRVYDYMKIRLIEANLHKKIELLEEVEQFAVQLTETWAAAMAINKGQN